MAPVGSQLETARISRGWSTRDAADAAKRQGLEVSHTAIRNYELGKRTPTSVTLEGLARLYQRDVSWFRGNAHVLQGFRYRALKAVGKASKENYQARAAGWIFLYSELLARLAKKFPKQWREPQLEFAPDPNAPPEQIAGELREVLGLGVHPVPSVVRALERLGVLVIMLDCSDRIDAFAATYGTRRIVVLNGRLSSDRIRLTAAHELGHHIYDDCAASQHLSNEEVERRAFDLGSHFLLPQFRLESALAAKSLVRLVEYRERYGISLAAMVHRAEHTRLISKRQAKDLWVKFAKYGWRRTEPGFVRPDRAVRLEVAMDTALECRLTSEHELALLAGVSPAEINTRIARAMDADLFDPQAEPAFQFREYTN